MFRRSRRARERRRLHSVGAAEASYRASLVKELQDKVIGFKGDEVVYMSVGDGTTSEGEWWEALNTACNLKLPVIFVVEDNGYAISVPVEVGTAGGDISKLVVGFPGSVTFKMSTAPTRSQSYAAFKTAVEYCRARKGPAFIHGKVIRPYSHSLSDDEKLYRPDEERQADAAIDPIKTLRRISDDRGHRLERGSRGFAQRGRRRGQQGRRHRRSRHRSPQGEPPTEMSSRRMSIRPTVQLFDTEDGAELSGNPGTMVDLINRCMHEEMERDPRIVVFGEDVADVSREEYLETVKGKGGVFKVTANLQRKFGSARVFNSPLAEANIVGRAVGLALRD